jgi:hypothetical protein
MNVGAMKDYKLELRNLHASHALGLGVLVLFLFQLHSFENTLWNENTCGKTFN